MNAPLVIPSEPPTAEGATPVMAQYFEAKARQPDALIFFRMGDFYELFFDDAAKASAAIGITLTHRGTHAGQPIPMAGVPAHAAEAYLAKLIRAGFKVAVCEQLEDPSEARKRGAKAVVRRDVVRVVTPGTLTEDGLLEARHSNRLAAIGYRGGVAALASVELSTGDVECLSLAPEGLAAAIAALRPSELLAPDRLFGDATIGPVLREAGGIVQPLPSALAEPAASESRLKRLYAVQTLDGFGPLNGAEVAALGLIAAHLDSTQAGRTPMLRPPRRATDAEIMSIDPATRASLEIERTLSGARDGSLLSVMDRTVTAPGARLLGARLSRPLRSPARINERLDAVAWFVDQRADREALRSTLKGAPDMARALSRLVLGRGGPRDLLSLRDGLRVATEVYALIGEVQDKYQPRKPNEITDAVTSLNIRESTRLASMARALAEGLEDDPPALAREGGFVASGVSSDLDVARSLRDDSRKIVASLEGDLSRESGVALKVRHNAVLGYFIETTARQAEPLLQAPLSTKFIHRQTLANQIRFTTIELADLDARISRAADQVLALELGIFERWRMAACELGAEILAAAEGLARLDVASGLAEWACDVGAVRPIIDESLVFEAKAARHPVVEMSVRRTGGVFTPNDCALDGSGMNSARLSIVTGPNMAGKSTFLRQNALLSIMAQTGSFVPAAALRLGVVDRLFSRVGAGDDLARGRSTFMAEMVETAAILTQATPRSLVILDEIGRGTATYDGLAIAWACAEALHDTNQCRALFATHYHELATLEGRLKHVSNLSLRAKEWNGDLVFLHEAGPGCADRSYGVQVARLAGVPPAVVARAREVLARLESEGVTHTDLNDLPLFAATITKTVVEGPSAVELALTALDVDGLSPREAIDALYRLRSLL